MHGGFKDEVHASLGSAGRLPQVFVNGKHLGGTDDFRRMHEAGELSKELEACEMAPSGVRFVPVLCLLRHARHLFDKMAGLDFIHGTNRCKETKI